MFQDSFRSRQLKTTDNFTTMSARLLRKLSPSCLLAVCFTLAVVTYSSMVSVLVSRDSSSTTAFTGVDFEGFDNVTGMDHFIVPNIVHYIRFNKDEFNFVDYVCILSAYRNQRPDYFYFHTNSKAFKGFYWDKIRDNGDLYTRIRVIPTEPPTEIFGQPLNPDWIYFHGSDITRIRLLMKYGGIFLDSDSYVVKSLDKYRRYEMAINWDEDQFLGCQIIVAHKDARFLRLWLDSYRQYNSTEWYYNAGEKPTKEILYVKPHLIHRVKVKFGVDIWIGLTLYNSYKEDWRTYDTIHLLINHRYYNDPLYSKMPEFDLENIKEYNATFGEMARDVLDL